MEIDPEENIWFVRHVDSVDGEPVALEEIYIPYCQLPNIGEVDIKLFSIYDIYQWNGIQAVTWAADFTDRLFAAQPGKADQY